MAGGNGNLEECGKKVHAGKFPTVCVKTRQVCYLGISMWPKGKL